MKKIISAVAAAIVMCSMTASVHALTFEFGQSSLLKFWEVADQGNDQATFILQKVAYPHESVWYETSISRAGQNGDFASMFLGFNASGSSSFGGNGNPTVASVGALDLSGFDRYGLNVYNDNQSRWDFRLRLETANTNVFESAWVSLIPGQSAPLLMNLTGIQALNNVTAIGLEVGSYMIGTPTNQEFPSSSDYAHFIVGPVPEPASMLLLGTGLLGLVGLRKRKTVK